MTKQRYRPASALLLTLIVMLQQACSSTPTPYRSQRNEAIQMMMKANSLAEQSDYPGALKIYKAACNRFAMLDDLDNQMDCHINASLALLRRGNSDEAKKSLENLLIVAKNFKLLQIQGKIHNHLALIYIQEKRYEKAEEEIKLSIQLYQKSAADDEFTYRSLASLGFIQRKLGRYQEAMHTLKKALSSEAEATRSYIYINLAELYFTQKRWRLARTNIDKAIEIDKIAARGNYLAYNYYWKCKILKEENQWSRAEIFCLRSLNTALSMNQKKLIQNLRAFLSNEYEQRKDREKLDWLEQILE